MAHDWVLAPPGTLSNSGHLEGSIVIEDIKVFTCSRCKYTIETNQSPTLFKKAPDCDLWILHNVHKS